LTRVLIGAIMSIKFKLNRKKSNLF